MTNDVSGALPADAVGFVVLLLAAAVVIGAIAERVRVPYVVALLLVSLPLQARQATSAFGPALFFVFLPALVFEAAWQLDLSILKRVWRPAFFLALPGVALTTLAIAFAASLAGMPLLEAFLLGAILSATDPIAVVATFRNLAIPAELATIVEAESLFNDGVAAGLYGALVVAANGANASPLGAIALDALRTTAGGVAMGLAVATMVVITLQRVRDSMLAVVGTVVGAYGAYLLADHLHFSGIFAALVTAMALRAFRRFPADASAQVEIDRFWSVLAFIANALVFLLLGLRIQLNRTLNEPLMFAATLGAVAVSRVALAYLVTPLLRVAGGTPGWRHAIVFAGMRGALSLALALALPTGTPLRAQIIDIVFGVVTVTLVIQGLAIAPVLRRVKL